MSAPPSGNPPLSPNDQQFDASAYAKADEVKGSIEVISSRVKTLEEKYGSNEELANTLRDASRTMVVLQDMHKELFVKMLQSDVDAKNAVIALIKESDREQVATFYRKFGTIVWAGIGVVSGAIFVLFTQTVPTIIDMLLGKKP